MSRVLFFIAIFVIVFLLLKYYRKQKIRDGDAEKKAATTAEAKQTEDMVRCVQKAWSRVKPAKRNIFAARHIAVHIQTKPNNTLQIRKPSVLVSVAAFCR